MLPSVHPRACGERLLPGIAKRSHRRFIPARAGNGAVRISAYSDDRRFIPARAGNGADADFMRSSLYRFGSSPRVRGTVRLGNPGRRSSHRRFIPARAGNGAVRISVHSLTVGSSPRVRGTEIARSWKARPSYGSSPRVRGTVGSKIVPAIVSPGSSPRVRGTDCNAGSVEATLFIGSSPRVRGTVIRGNGSTARPYRFIPARAGNG